MLWILIVVTLSFQPSPHIIAGHIVKTFHSEQECIKEQRKFFKEAEEEGIEIPLEVQMGCVSYKKKGV